ncbi:uncharacterized protein [Diadema antillarum]|uniref:uncharacterized protein n=1 Tax=Diadema antillarum TaxID=105358 RepID=UPI003A88CF14
MKQPQMQAPMVPQQQQQQQFSASLRHTLPAYSGGERKHKRAGVANFTMSDCYEKLKQLVPTIPKNRKVTRVEILQHVIDYIQDLQTALEGQNINVKVIGNLNELSGMMRGAMPVPTPAAPNRTPFTTLVPQQRQNQQHCPPPPPMPLGHNNQANMMRQQQCQSQQTSLFQQPSYNEFRHRQQMSHHHTANMAVMSQHPGPKLHPYETPESSPESRPCSC